MPQQIAFHDVSFSYDGERDALRHVDLGIREGSYVAVLGPNGSGKSTIARMMNALLVPDSGEVVVCGIPLGGGPDARARIRRHVGMVFQNPDNQMVTTVVADDVAFGPENLGVPQPQICERVDRALASVGMTEYAQADPAELSGGQKQRVAIAGALAMKPEVLVFDEPCAMLDPRGHRAVLRMMRELNDRGITVVHITHFMEDALEADEVHVVQDGLVALSGTPDEVFRQGDRLRELGLEQPFAMQLAQALRARGVRTVAETARPEVLREKLCALMGASGAAGATGAAGAVGATDRRPACL